MSPRVRALLAKELRQVRRSRGALLSATLLPILVMVVTPLGQALSLGANAGVPLKQPGMVLPPGLAAIDDPAQLFGRFLLPLMVMIGGLIVPPVAATYTIVVERERRSLELLIALPVSVRDILLAKLLAMLALALTVVLPLFALDAAVVLWLRLVPAALVVLLFGLLLCALVCSVGCALLVALLARDLRTANNVSGALLGPLILVELGVLMGVPGDAGLLLAGALLLLVGVGTFAIGVRWLSFERYLA